jgi:tRNA-Thr(GGU) m(6)t(6)A37 methyltransferase TsaA
VTGGLAINHKIKEKKMKNSYQLSSIGQVRATAEGFYLQLEQPFRPALVGLDDFSYVNVLWWANLLDTPEQRAEVTCRKPYKSGPDTVGVFATRSPLRPNPVCVTTVALLYIDHEAGRLYIPYIDAEDGTPVLDIKPYHPATDRIREVTVPNWCRHWPQWMEDSATFDWAAEFENAR